LPDQKPQLIRCGFFIARISMYFAKWRKTCMLINECNVFVKAKALIAQVRQKRLKFAQSLPLPFVIQQF
jgi:hypothetical protein